jgi:hypothetical protein
MIYNSERPRVLTHLGRSTTRDIRSIGMPQKNATSDELRQYIIDSSKPTAPSGCWEWGRAKDLDGYGLLYVGGRMRRAHRVSYQLFAGDIPAGAFVCHSCDNPACCNPEHLWVGSPQDNQDDCRDKGRTARGERNRHARLSVSDVCAIRRRHASGGITKRALAKKFGVTPTAIAHIVKRKTWRHVP